MKISYSKCGDYQIPNLTVPDESRHPIGKYGSLRKSYLKEHRNLLYKSLLMNGTLFKHLSEIDESCHQYMNNIISAMSKQEGVTESLKAIDQMDWLRKINSIHSRAEEIVLKDLVYSEEAVK